MAASEIGLIGGRCRREGYEVAENLLRRPEC
jgi:hypothetical protein